MATARARWFSAGANTYLALAQCPRHGYVKGKIRIKKAADGNVFAVKTTKKADPAAVAQNDTIANTSILQPTIGAMANFWDPCKTFGTAIVSGDVNAGNAQAKAQAWLDGYKNIASTSNSSK